MIADLTGRNALVTGGGQGIGRGIALKLAEQGANVAIADISDSGASAVVDEVKALGRKSFAVYMDVTDNVSVATAVENVIAEFGHLDILINNAGIGRVEGKAGGGLHEDWEENWNTVTRYQRAGRDASALRLFSVISWSGGSGRSSTRHRVRDVARSGGALRQARRVTRMRMALQKRR